MQEDLNYWLKVSKDWLASGLSQREYCKGAGINYRHFGEHRTLLIHQGLVESCSGKAVNNLPTIAIPVREDVVNFLPLSTKALKLTPELTERTRPQHIEIKLPFGIVMSIPTNVA